MITEIRKHKQTKKQNINTAVHSSLPQRYSSSAIRVTRFAIYIFFYSVVCPSLLNCLRLQYLHSRLSPSLHYLHFFFRSTILGRVCWGCLVPDTTNRTCKRGAESVSPPCARRRHVDYKTHIWNRNFNYSLSLRRHPFFQVSIQLENES